MSWALFNPRKHSSWRLTLSIALMVSVLLLSMTWVLYQALLTEQQRQIGRELQTTASRIQGLATSSEPTRFYLRLQQMQSQEKLLLTWQHKGEVLGALSLFPKAIPELPQTASISVFDPKLGQLRQLQAGIVVTPFGNVMVAQSTELLDQLIERFILTALWALAAALVMTLLLGNLLARRQMSRLDQFNRTLKQVEAGDLKQRLSIKANGDEYDQLGRSINAMIHGLEQHLDTVRSVTDNIAHDLRTPLSRLRFSLERRLTTDETIGFELEQLDLTLASFDALLTLSQLEHGKRQLSTEQIEVDELFEQVVDLLQLVAEEQSQQLRCQPSGLSVSGDERLLYQALFNVVDNAIKYAGADAGIVLSAEANGGDLVISVADNGQGVDEAQLSSLTQRSFRGDSSRQQAGFGLGLAMVKAIVERHGGRLELALAHPGLVVRFVLPLSQG